jgi:hypothetical protein
MPFGVMGSPPSFSSAECLPFIMVPFSVRGGALVISLVQGPSPLTDHFCYSQDTPFSLFKAEASFNHAFASFHVPVVLSA